MDGQILLCYRSRVSHAERSPLSRTVKEGKRDGYTRLRAGGRTEAPEIKEAICKRQIFGATEKILRRNRKVWTRLGNKRRRRLDKEAVLCTERSL